MEQSDLSKLKIFLNTLPEDKVLDPWNERYIYDIDTYSGYDAAKSLAIQRNRYVKFDEMATHGYDLDIYKSQCDKPKEDREYECKSCCTESTDLNSEKTCEYDPIKCNRFFAKNVTNWSELCGYHILFLQGKTPGTPDHVGPWSTETSYIIDPLIRILKAGILTNDSEPGLMVKDDDDLDNEEYIQKPYLVIGGPVGRIHRILIKILFPNENILTIDNSIIRYVSYDLPEINFDGYINYDKNDKEDYVTVTLGIDDPSMLSAEVMEYIYSNRFFDRIADIVETTG